MSRLLVSVFALGLAAAALADPALAQPAATPDPTPPAMPKYPPSTGMGGTAVTGVCLLSVDAVIAGSKAGQAASARLGDLAKAADQELAPERTAIKTENDALTAERARLSPADLQKRTTALNARIVALETQAQQRNRELAATREKALGQIAAAAQPLITTAYSRHACGLLARREAFLGGNFANDLTAEVTQTLDARLPALAPFDREHLPPATAQP